MSHIDTPTTNIPNNFGACDNNPKYWCFACEREFSQRRTKSSEVYCPQCHGICELIDPSDDPRNFRPYDAQIENSQPNSDSSSLNPLRMSQRQQSEPQHQQLRQPQSGSEAPRLRIIYQMPRSSYQAFVAQNPAPQDDTNSIIQNRRNARAEINQNSNQQEAPQQNQEPQLIAIGANMLGPVLANPFGMLNALSFGVPLPAVLFGDLEDRIIEEFLRNDPNRYGPPPAPEESITKLKEIQFNDETCQAKDCSICQEDFKSEDNLLVMPCEHTFHKDCLSKWLHMHNSCPVCRKSLENGEEADA